MLSRVMTGRFGSSYSFSFPLDSFREIISSCSDRIVSARKSIANDIDVSASIKTVP